MSNVALVVGGLPTLRPGRWRLDHRRLVVALLLYINDEFILRKFKAARLRRAGRVALRPDRCEIAANDNSARK